LRDHLDHYVAAGRFPGWLCAVGRDGGVAWVGHGGRRDVERGLPVEADTLWRIYSMSKPVTSVAAMLLHEESRFDLNDEVSRWIPSFADVRVYVDGPADAPVTRPAKEPIRVWHLLTHTAGLTYGFQRCHTVDAIYRAHGYDFGAPAGTDLASAVDDFAALPLLFDPGDAWNYSVATDVVGRLVELWSGQPLDAFLEERVLGPLGMHETAFFCPEERVDRLAALYLYDEGDTFKPSGALGEAATRRPRLLGGGGGLVSTAADYQRFATMLLGDGALGDVRLLAPSTVALMSRNFLPGGGDIESMARDSFAESSMSGVGFGLGLSCVLDGARLRMPTPEGTVSWGGAASTTFWVDPVEAITCVFFTQLLPSSSYPIRRELQRLVYQAVVD
jgi:CubicO group peptidase (beta-lactamase class C family)